MNKYSFLEPYKIGSVEAKNRVMYLAMAKSISSMDGTVTPRDISYIKSIAEGGVGIIVPGAMIVDPEWPSALPMQSGIYDDRFLPGLKSLVAAAHDSGSKIFFQLWHPGQVAYTPGLTPPTINDFSKKQLDSIRNKFVAAAIRAKVAGADGIEFQVCHNYLGAQFISSLYNKRSDEYGWENIENRVRFPVECITSIREAIGDMAICVKLQAFDGLFTGGVKLEEAVQISPYIEKSGADMISVSAGGLDSEIISMSGDSTKPEGWKVQAAAAIKQAVSIPVCATDSIRTPAYADEIIRNGSCDIIGIGRGIYAEREWVKKSEEGREDELKYCINCMHCFNFNHKYDTSGCNINPFALRETEIRPIKKDGNNRVIAIVGAGPAGLEAAVTLSERGFRPIVFEKALEIGGMLRLAGRPPQKDRLYQPIEYYKKEIKRLDIEVRLNTKATADMIQELNPYSVLIASGSEPVILPIPGVDGETIVLARDVLEEEMEISNKSIVVVGAGLTGIETAQFLNNNGNDLTLVDISTAPDISTIGLPMGMPVEIAIEMIRSQFEGIKFLYDNKVLKIDDTGVDILDTNTGEKSRLPADLVVMSAGVKPSADLYDEMSDKRERVYKIGDANFIGKIGTAVMAGSKFACVLE